MTVMVLTIFALRRKNIASPEHQGFMEVDQSASPEDRHIANMQINGYENPTYKYFEESDT
jgi:amyloid beta A4 protein